MEKLSFSATLKTDLSKVKPTGCCRIAECYGLLLFGRSFCSYEISLRTAVKEVAEHYASLVKLCFDVHTVVTESGDVKKSYLVSVPGEADRARIINYYDSGEQDWIMNPKFLKRNCCRWAFVKGAFLSCGSINDPEKSYHLEFAVKDPTLGFAFAAFLELCGHKPKHSQRASVTALYYNSSETVEELLGGMGALRESLEVMELKVVKSMRNRLNRRNNFETANISKTVNAAVEQTQAIEFLLKENLIGMLPEELSEVAFLRKENPDASLAKLCKLSGDSISRSGMNHRLQRIVAFANEEKLKKFN